MLRGHLIKAYPEAIHGGSSDGNNLDAELAPPRTKQTLALPPPSPLTYGQGSTRGGRGGARGGRVATRGGRGGGRGGDRKVNPKNLHMTDGATCEHCGIKNHTAAQC